MIILMMMRRRRRIRMISKSFWKVTAIMIPTILLLKATITVMVVSVEERRQGEHPQ
jgi:signal transduction histidine kinase